MAQTNSAMDALHSFARTINDSLIEPLKKNQVKFAWQRDVRESKRYQEAENKINDFAGSYMAFKNNFGFGEEVMKALRDLQASRMTQFIEKGKAISPEESPELKEALEPLYNLLKPVEDIRRLQLAMLSQGKLKKLPLPYDEIMATLSDVTALAAKLPQLLMNDITERSETLGQVA
jgi:hypothetical protein